MAERVGFFTLAYSVCQPLSAISKWQSFNGLVGLPKILNLAAVKNTLKSRPGT